MKLSRDGVDWLIFGCVNAAVPLTVGWKHYIGEISTHIALVGGLISIVVANIALVLARRARNMHQGKVTSGNPIFKAIGLAALAALGTAFSAYWVPEQNEYLRLALSDTPLDQIHPEREALVVELTREQIANTQQENRIISGMKPISPPLFSADSFASENAIRSVLRAYEAATEADFSYSEQQQRAMSEFRDKMSKVDPDFLKSFELAQRDREEAAASTLALERNCLTATRDLYDYAATHTAEIAVKNGALDFSNDSVRRDFSTKLQAGKALFDALQTKVREQVALQQQAGRSAGISLR